MVEFEVVNTMRGPLSLALLVFLLCHGEASQRGISIASQALAAALIGQPACALQYASSLPVDIMQMLKCIHLKLVDGVPPDIVRLGCIVACPRHLTDDSGLTTS